MDKIFAATIGILIFVFYTLFGALIAVEPKEGYYKTYFRTQMIFLVLVVILFIILLIIKK